MVARRLDSVHDSAADKEVDMDQATMAGDPLEMHDGDEFVCPNCGCNLTLKHHGDPAKVQEMRPFTCCCGTAMHSEHPESQ
jgi:hypothetical protein